MPRIKHEHRWTRTVRIKGSRQRYGCADCPVVDPYWYRIPGVSVGPAQAPPKRREGVGARARADQDLSGLHGVAQGPAMTFGEQRRAYEAAQGVGFTIDKAHHDPDGTQVIEKVSLINVSIGPDALMPGCEIQSVEEPTLMIGRAQTPPPLPVEPDIANVKDRAPDTNEAAGIDNRAFHPDQLPEIKGDELKRFAAAYDIKGRSAMKADDLRKAIAARWHELYTNEGETR